MAERTEDVQAHWTRPGAEASHDRRLVSANSRAPRRPRADRLCHSCASGAMAWNDCAPPGLGGPSPLRLTDSLTDRELRFLEDEIDARAGGTSNAHLVLIRGSQRQGADCGRLPCWPVSGSIARPRIPGLQGVAHSRDGKRYRARLRGEPRPVRDSTLARIGAAHGCSAAALALAWTIRSGNVIAIPESGLAAHVKENAVALSLILTPEDLQTLDAAHPPLSR
jgi:Aldo/keto reductase family